MARVRNDRRQFSKEKSQAKIDEAGNQWMLQTIKNSNHNRKRIAVQLFGKQKEDRKNE